MARTFTAVIQHDPESGCYVGSIPALPGAHSCGETLADLRANLKEAIELMLEVMAQDGEISVEDVQVLLEPIEIAV